MSESVGQVALGRVTDEGPPPADRLDEPLRPQLGQSLPQQWPAHAELGRHLGLSGQALADLQAGPR